MIDYNCGPDDDDDDAHDNAQKLINVLQRQRDERRLQYTKDLHKIEADEEEKIKLEAAKEQAEILKNKEAADVEEVCTELLGRICKDRVT